MKRLIIMVLAAVMGGQLCASLSDGLVARYEFSGSLADSTGHGYTLHSNKAESYVADRFGKADSAYWLDGSTALFDSDTTEEPVWYTNYTFACWFKASETTALVDVKSSGIWGTSSSIKYLCGHTDYPIAVGTNGINIFEHASYFLPAVFRYDADLGTSWHHISFTVTTNVDAVVYLDGQQIGSFKKIRDNNVVKLGLGYYDSGSAKRYIGLGAFCYGGCFAGGVDEARFYNRPLSAAEVKAVYDSERVKTYYVNGTTGSDENPGTSPGAAKKTIQAAIDVSMDGDTILVAPGTYAPIATHNKAILIRGMEGARSTFIDGGNTKTCAIMWQNGDPGSSLSRRSTVEGFTLQNGCAGDDMAAAAERGCVTRCIIRYCHGGGYSGACGCRCCTVVDTLAYENSYGSSEYGCWGGGVMMNSDTMNCTVVNNQGYGLWDTTSWNTISWNNMYEGQVKDFYVSYGCEGKLNYCLTKTSIGSGEGNITGTPQFVNAAENDYRLVEGSIGIDVGDNAHVTNTTDLAGNVRIWNDIVDIGCYEYGSYPPLEAGLVAWYRLDGDTKDSSGCKNDLTNNGAIATLDRHGRANGAMYLDGNSCISAIDDKIVLAKESGTLAGWFKAENAIEYFYPESTSGTYYSAPYAFMPSSGGWVSEQYWLWAGVGFALGTNGVMVYEHTGLYLPTPLVYKGNIGNGWIHVCITYYDNGEESLYINGCFIKSGLKSTKSKYIGFSPKDDGPAGIGGGGYGHFTGSVDDIRIYERTLSDAEVKALYDSEKPPAPIVLTVSFDACGGVASQDTKVVTNNTAIGELPTAERDGHKFLGWYSEIEGGTQVTPESIITNDVTFYAHWFDTSIGNVTGATNVLWRTGGDVPWATEETPEGWDVRSGAIDKNSETWVECVVTNGCRVAFQWKVSCEPEDEGEMYDFLSFSIDGEPKAAICGEVGWTNDVYCVSGAGEHILRWTYQKDNRTSAGEDCGWLGRVRVDPEVPVTFKDNGATSGEVPTIPTAYLGDAITIPGKGTLAKSCHAFGGWEYGETTYPEGAAFTLGTNTVEFVAVWNAKVLGLPILVSPATPHVTTEKIAVSLQTPASAQGIRYTIDGSEPTAESAVYTGPFEIEDRGVTVKAVAFADDWFDSACATWELTRAPWSAAECLNAETREFSFGGNADWVRDLSVTHDGEAAMRSGAIQDKQTSQILMPVTGEGTVSFWCKVSSEWDPGTKEVYDGLAIAIDGKDVYPGLIGGEVGWTNITVGVSGAGEHVICWRYQKDKVSSAGSDCAWIDEVLWQVDETVVPAAITGDRDLPISRSWIEKDLVDRYGPGKTEAFRDKFGNDYDLAVLMPNGKTMGGNPGFVWEDYIAGTDPTDTNSVFAASISMEGGVPKLIWNPDLGVERLYKVWGKASLVGGDWQCPTNSTHRFFKVTVEMP